MVTGCDREKASHQSTAVFWPDRRFHHCRSRTIVFPKRGIQQRLARHWPDVIAFLGRRPG